MLFSSVARVKFGAPLDSEDEVCGDATTQIEASSAYLPGTCVRTGFVIPIADVEGVSRGVRARVRLGRASRYTPVGRRGCWFGCWLGSWLWSAVPDASAGGEATPVGCSSTG